jgi:acyl-CoA dehydrogenase
MSVVAEGHGTFLDGISAAAGVAAQAADDVDRLARFPEEAMAELRRQRAMSAWLPCSLGGSGVSLHEVAAACFELGRSCAATGMVYAMHQIQVGTIVRHFGATPTLEKYLGELSERQLLIASATSEIGVGGDLRRSIAAVTPGSAPGEITVEKMAATISYGAQADDVLVTARRSPDAEPNDQVLVLARKADTNLEQLSQWDVLGMRGTCSPGFALRTTASVEHVLPTPFGDAATQTMVPLSHILWSHVWLGIASSAYDRARAFVRDQMGRRPGAVPDGATRLSELFAQVQSMRSEVRLAADEYAAMTASDAPPGDLFTIGFALRQNMLKINASEAAPRICQGALAINGIAGFRNDTPYSVGRHLRDALSASLMIGNDRLHATNAALLLVHKG